MLYRDFGKTGMKVSAIGMGCWNIGDQWGQMDDATAWSVIRAAFDNGINLYDVAESYGVPNGQCEERLGAGLAGIRHRVHVVTKIGFWGNRTGQKVHKTTVDIIRLCCHACLHRLRTDWVDVLMCHFSDVENPEVWLEAFEVLKKQGKIRAGGISTDSLEVVKKMNINGTCDVVEFDYSLLNRESEEKLLGYCKENGIAVLARGPLAKGLLSGKYSAKTKFTDSVRSGWHSDDKAQAQMEAQIAEVEKFKKALPPDGQILEAALRYVISHPAEPVAIAGARSPEQAKTNASAGEKLLTDNERKKLLAVFD